MKTRQNRLFVSLALFVLLAFGCKKSPFEKPDEKAQMAQFGRLPGLSHSQHPGLQDELARLIAEGATPELLTTGAASAGPSAVPDDENAAVALLEVFRTGTIARLNRRAEELMPRGKFQFDPVDLEKAIEFRAINDDSRRKARAAVERPKCDFQLQHTMGLAADTSCVEVVRICVRLEALLAAELLAKDEPDEAAEPLAYMLRLVGLLAKERRVVTRLAAAELRGEAFRVMEALVEKPNVSAATLVHLSELLAAQLVAWPPDADAWIGDRALGMHTYEMIRGGYVASVLSTEETERFREEGNLKALLRAVVRSVDQDQAYYLAAMRTVVAGCEKPFYQRQEIFRTIDRQLYEVREKDDFPTIAARILLPEIEQAQRQQAKDRAAAEAWAIALAAVTQQPEPPYETNPFTGKPYRLTREATRIVVEGVGIGGADRPVSIPMPESE